MLRLGLRIGRSVQVQEMFPFDATCRMPGVGHLDKYVQGTDSVLLQNNWFIYLRSQCVPVKSIGIRRAFAMRVGYKGRRSCRCIARKWLHNPKYWHIGSQGASRLEQSRDLRSFSSSEGVASPIVKCG